MISGMMPVRFTLSFCMVLVTEVGFSKTFNFCGRLDTLTGAPEGHSRSSLDFVTSEVTSLLIRKDTRRLYLLNNDTILKSYPVAFGLNPSGHKTREGDFKTPEGIYFISKKRPDSNYHKSLKISYPDAEDLLSAQQLGVEPGGDIFIHGFPNEPGLNSPSPDRT